MWAEAHLSTQSTTSSMRSTPSPTAVLSVLCLVATLFCSVLGQPVSSFGGIHSHSYNAQTFPNPRLPKYMDQCRPPDGVDTLFVCDPDGVLSERDRARLNDELTELARETADWKLIGREGEDPLGKCAGGVHLGVALASNPIHSASSRANYANNKELATKTLRQNWDLGGCGEGRHSAMLVLVESEHQITKWMEEDMPLTRAELQALISRESTLLQHGRFAQALLNVVAGVRRLSRHRMHILSSVDGGTRTSFWSLPLVVVICCLFLGLVESAKWGLRRHWSANKNLEHPHGTQCPAGGGTASANLEEMLADDHHRSNNGNGKSEDPRKKALPPLTTRRYAPLPLPPHPQPQQRQYTLSTSTTIAEHEC